MTNFHVVRVAPVVNLTLRKQIDANPEYDELDYSAFLEKILAEHYNYGDVFSHYMSKLGNRAEEIVYDIESLQKKWAAENNLQIEEGEPWQLKIVLEQLKKLNPDIVYLQGFTRVTVKAVYEIRHEIPNLKRIAVHSGFPNGTDVVNDETIVFCGFPNIQKTFSKLGCEAHLLYHFFDERVLEHVRTGQQKYPLSFVGTSGYGYGDGHKTRYWELLKMGEKTPLHYWVDDKDKFSDPNGSSNPFTDRPLKDNFYSSLTDDINQYPNPITPLRNLVNAQSVHKPVYGWDYFQVLADSAVTFQRHTDAMFHEVGAMRIFQATGVGSCLLTNNGTNMRELYEPDFEVVTYTTLEECIEKANYLVDNPAKAAEIAKKGQQRTLRDHNAKTRYEFVNQVLSEAIRNLKRN